MVNRVDTINQGYQGRYWLPGLAGQPQGGKRLIQPDHIILQTVHDPYLQARDISLRVLRLDLAHPVLGGNKWYKLNNNLQLARSEHARRLLTFGGAYSNHVYAFSAAAAAEGFESLAVIRGELVEPLNSTLAFASRQGTQLISVSRGDYRRRHDPDYIKQLQEQYGPFYLIPEGGANVAGVSGCEAIAELLISRVDDLPCCEIVLACGTGTTLAGLVAGLSRSQREGAAMPRVRGFAVLKGADFLRNEISHWLQRLDCPSDAIEWVLETNYHGGGYARADTALLEFIEHFSRCHDIPLEPVYTGKLLYGVYQRIAAGHVARGSKLLMLHTGGLRMAVE